MPQRQKTNDVVELVYSLGKQTNSSVLEIVGWKTFCTSGAVTCQDYWKFQEWCDMKRLWHFLCWYWQRQWHVTHTHANMWDEPDFCTTFLLIFVVSSICLVWLLLVLVLMNDFISMISRWSNQWRWFWVQIMSYQLFLEQCNSYCHWSWFCTQLETIPVKLSLKVNETIWKLLLHRPAWWVGPAFYGWYPLLSYGHAAKVIGCSALLVSIKFIGKLPAIAFKLC